MVGQVDGDQVLPIKYPLTGRQRGGYFSLMPNILRELIETEIEHCRTRLLDLQTALKDLTRRQGPQVQLSEASDTGVGTRTKKKRTMSASARKRISEAQKARWAKQKKS